MSVFTKYSHKKGYDWGIDTSAFPFVKCSDMPLDEKLPIFGFFITPDSGYGEGAIVILEDKLLSIPQRYVEDIKAFLNDESVLSVTKRGKAAIIITEFESKKFKKTGYDVEFVEA